MKLNLIDLRVSDWENMVKWYQEALSLKPVHLEPEHRYGWLDAGDIRVGINGIHPLAPVSDRLAMSFEVENLDDAMKRLETFGCAFFDIQDDAEDGYRLARFRDPEGNVIAIYELTATA